MSVGSPARIVALLLLALYLMAPGSVIVHILEEGTLLGHAEEPIHLELPASPSNPTQSGSLPCSLCEQGEKVLPGSVPLLVHPPSVSSYAAPAERSASMRPGDPPFIPPEGNV
ncbi:hypothetical protein [Trichlorobacter ammonificans]|uniref:DUF2946 domain-containing protein n=1 Tax=Trichlorobacter ammonificans TaxID=2916410 RepID=A0ABN8HHG5_9BACT|nr:hypothetical protein [Trichlorobacter ammonificans]CAH2030929.1 protein of unknown function [Trichlorobacter ammonificans]